MSNSTWPVIAAGAAAVTIACGAFALGAAMTSDTSSGAAASPSSSPSASTTPGPPAPGAVTTVPARTTAPTAAGAAVEIVDFAFGPADLSVAAGSTVTWTNSDDVAHSVVSADAVLSSPDMDQGATYEMTLDQAGTLDYYCGIHQYMKATIAVTP